MSQKLIEIKNRIASVENIKNTTQTMATVAAAKFARTRNRALKLGAYSSKMHDIISSQSEYASLFDEEIRERYPLLSEKAKTNKRVVLAVIASDIGMCGNYNSQITRLAHQFIEEKEKEETEVYLVTKGLKAEEYFRKKTKNQILHKFNWSTEGVSIKDADDFLSFIHILFEKAEIDSIYIAYTKFYSAVKREPVIVKLLPIPFDVFSSDKTHGLSGWIYEPDAFNILDELIPTYLRIQTYDILLESYASEQGARMMAMEEATERAEVTLKDLKVRFNKIRRSLITLDLLGILSAARVLEKESIASSGF